MPTGFFSNQGNGKQLVATDNVDFSGAANPSPSVTLDGQLLIGSSISPNIRVNTLTPGSGVSITNGNGSITIGLSGGGSAIQSIAVDTTTGAGTNPVLPTGAGLVTFTG